MSNPTDMINLTVQFMRERHQYWAKKLFEEKIFKTILPQINFEIKYSVKSFNGKFKVRINSGKAIQTIILYPTTSTPTLYWIDSILVHEMIHQYIYHQQIKDTSSHGRYFKYFMNSINLLFDHMLKINVSTPVIRQQGKSNYISIFILLRFSDKFFLCKIKPSKIDYFNTLILGKKIDFKWPLVTYGWYTSNDIYFKDSRECTSRLSGSVFPNYRFEEIIEKYNLKKYQTIEEL